MREREIFFNTFYDKLVNLVYHGWCPTFVPVEIDGKETMYYSIMRVKPEFEGMLGSERWPVETVCTTYRLAREDGVV